MIVLLSYQVNKAFGVTKGTWDMKNRGIGVIFFSYCYTVVMDTLGMKYAGTKKYKGEQQRL